MKGFNQVINMDNFIDTNIPIKVIDINTVLCNYDIVLIKTMLERKFFDFYNEYNANYLMRTRLYIPYV